MNIALVTPEFVTDRHFDGGLAMYTYKLASWLLEKGHRVTVFHLTDKNETAVFEGIPVERVMKTDYAWMIKYYMKKLYLHKAVPDQFRFRYHFRKQAKNLNDRIKQAHAKEKFDIIHYPHLGGFCFGRWADIPAIVRLSGSTELCQKMGGYGSSDIQVAVQSIFEKEAMKKADTVFGPSKMIASITEPQIGKKIGIIETPYVPLKESADTSVYNAQLKGKKYILFFGSIGLIKGVGTISEMIRSLLEKHPELYYVFVGKQLNNQYKGQDVWKYLLEQAGPYNNRVIYIPSLKHNALFPVIQNAEMITLPSRTDNFPNTCIESMANRKIVIGTKGNGFDQLITDNVNGFVIDVDDHKDLLSKIETVLSMDQKKKAEMEENAFKRSESLHPDIVLNQLLDLYKKTISLHKN